MEYFLFYTGLGSNTKVISCNDLNILVVPFVIPYLEHTLCDIF